MKRIGLTVMLLLVLAANVFAAATCEYRIAFPPVQQTLGDTTFALAVTAAKTGGYLFNFASEGLRPAWYRANLIVTTANSDIDSVTLITYGTCDGVNVSVLDSEEVTGSTAASAITYACSTSVAGDFCGFRNIFVVAKVFGDPAGSGKPEAIGYYSICFYDGNGNIIVCKENPMVHLRYVE